MFFPLGGSAGPANESALTIPMNDNPLLLLAVSAAVGYVVWQWLGDLRLDRQGRPNPQAWPGAYAASLGACLIAAAGGALITGAETWGELALGLSGQQSKMTVAFGAYSILVAPWVEELVFRGFIVIDGRGAALRWAGAVGASVLFAALHPFLWDWSAGQPFHFTFTAKGWFSTGVVFGSSLWFYAMRFSVRLNPRQSLLPCVAAHGARNLATFAIKLAQGFISGGW
jgi:hypothetical protein